MLYRFLLALGIALSHPASAYSGFPAQGARFEMDGAMLPLSTHFEPTRPSESTDSAADAVLAPSESRDPAPGTDARGFAAGTRPRSDAFERYFDRHYRAHLVLDASANRAAEIE